MSILGSVEDMEATQKVTEDPPLGDKTWMQLRQCTRIALYYIRSQVEDGSAPAAGYDALAEMEKVLAEGSTDPVV
jgi:hypothetical protein